MNLRQIIRKQKLSNFNYKLIDLISEADEEVKYIDKEGKTQTMAIAPALRLKDPKHPAKIAALKLRGDQEGPQKKPAGDEETDVKVKVDDETREKINDFGEELGLSISNEDPDSFADDNGNVLMTIGADGTLLPGADIEDLTPAEEKALEKSIDDFNDSTGAAAKITDFFNGGDEDPKEKKDVDDPARGSEDDADYRDISNTNIAGKDKSLSDVDSVETEPFTEPIVPDDTDFDAKNEKNKFPEPPPPYEMPQLDGNYPEKYNDLINRFVNTKLDDETSKISYFMESSAGAGKISSQAGEILTMAFTSLDDDQAKELESSLLDHLKAQKEADPKSKKIVDPSWVKAAMENRKAIRNRISKEYPEGSKIVASGWDVKEEVNALGMENYEDDKGFSTDVYFKVQTPDGKDILDEVSLKKDVNVNFLNSGTKKFSDWDENLGEELDQNVYTNNQRERLSTFAKKNAYAIENLLKKDKALQKEFSSKGIKSVAELLEKKSNRAVSKIMLKSAEAMAAGGDRTAAKFVREHREKSKEFAVGAVEALTTNKKLTDGMLNEIRGEFPLKAVSDGEETMAIGPYSLDPAIMKNIFGTNDFEKIKEKLVAVKEDPPYVGYQATVGGETIPIAAIDIREDGVGYGAVFRFDMKLDKRFAKTLKAANAQVYGEALNNLGNLLSETQENTLFHHWKKAEDNYPIHYFIRELNKDSLN